MVCSPLSPIKSYLSTGTLAATLPRAWCCKVTAITSWPGVSILLLGETASLGPE